MASDAATISAAHELLELCGGSARASDASEPQHDAKRAKLSSQGAGAVWPSQGQVFIGDPELTHKAAKRSQRKVVQQIAQQRPPPLQPTPVGFGAPAPAMMSAPPPATSAFAGHHPAGHHPAGHRAPPMQGLFAPPPMAFPPQSPGMAQYPPQYPAPPPHYAPLVPPPTFLTASAAARPPPTILTANTSGVPPPPVALPMGMGMGMPPPFARDAANPYAHPPRMPPQSRPSLLSIFLPDLAIPANF